MAALVDAEPSRRLYQLRPLILFYFCEVLNVFVRVAIEHVCWQLITPAR